MLKRSLNTSLLSCGSLILAITLAGCSNKPYKSHLIVDTKGINTGNYHQDKEECQAYTEQVRTGERVATEAAKGGVVGGVVGAVIGNSSTAQRGAGAGAVLGGVKGYDMAERELDRVMRNCLRGRGYRVLN